MSTAAVKALNIVLRVKRRRVEKAQAYVKTCQQALNQRLQEEQQAAQRAAECRAAEDAHMAKIEEMCSGAFVASALLVMRHVSEDLRKNTQTASQGVAAAQQQVQAARDTVRQAQRAVQKAESVVEFLEKRRKDMLQEIENAREELQDEESEEAAVGRMMAAVQAQAQAAAEEQMSAPAAARPATPSA